MIGSHSTCNNALEVLIGLGEFKSYFSPIELMDELGSLNQPAGVRGLMMKIVPVAYHPRKMLASTPKNVLLDYLHASFVDSQPKNQSAPSKRRGKSISPTSPKTLWTILKFPLVPHNSGKLAAATACPCRFSFSSGMWNAILLAKSGNSDFNTSFAPEMMRLPPGPEVTRPRINTFSRS
jgi:hypothetical protein